MAENAGDVITFVISSAVSSAQVIHFKILGGEGSRTPVSYAYVQHDPGQVFSERIQRQ